MTPEHRWTDDRLDDLSASHRALAAQVSSMQRTVDAHDAAIKQISRTGDRRSSRRWDLVLIGVTVIATQVASIVIQLH